MDDDEHSQLSDIHQEVKGSHAQLGVIEERTRNIEKKLEKVSENVSENEGDIDDLEDGVKRNTVIINAVTVGLSGVVLWAADKITRFNPF
jgi:peptidoglycan hydrolase CwlO-like protein